VRKKIGLRHFNALRSSLKVPTSATPYEVVGESVQTKRVWVFEWVVKSELLNTATCSSDFTVISVVVSSFRQQKKQTEVG